MELLSAQGVCDVLNAVAQTVRVVVGGVDAPLAAGPVVRLELDPVRHRVLFTLLQSDFHPESGVTFIDFTILHILRAK